MSPFSRNCSWRRRRAHLFVNTPVAAAARTVLRNPSTFPTSSSNSADTRNCSWLERRAHFFANTSAAAAARAVLRNPPKRVTLKRPVFRVTFLRPFPGPAATRTVFVAVASQSFAVSIAIDAAVLDVQLRAQLMQRSPRRAAVPVLHALLPACKALQYWTCGHAYR